MILEMKNRLTIEGSGMAIMKMKVYAIAKDEV